MLMKSNWTRLSRGRGQEHEAEVKANWHEAKANSDEAEAKIAWLT